MFNATFSNISAISWRPVLVVEEAGVPEEDQWQATNKLYHLQLRVECTLFYPSRDGPYYVIGYGRQVGGRPHRFPHNNFSSVYRIFIKLWKEKNPIYFGVIRSKVKVTITLNRIFDNRVVST